MIYVLVSLYFQAVLGSIIVVALKSMLFQYEDMPKFWKRSRLDGLLWIGSFLATVILDIDTGLVVGIALNLLLLIYRWDNYKNIQCSAFKALRVG